ncbi:hypothetical protein LV779_12255 [Streptomyces thinghirensis]|nr:hypothetical protein [Streptomyces thinghirensis]
MDLRFYHDGIGPGHLPGAARRPQHHLRGLRARLRHPSTATARTGNRCSGPTLPPRALRHPPNRSRPYAYCPSLGRPPAQLIKSTASASALLRARPRHTRQGEDRGSPRLPSSPTTRTR